jgi:HrpA-like RNA helicase
MQFYLENYFNDIEDVIKQSDITLLIAPSASGKSVGLPQYLSQSMNVLVVEKDKFHSDYFSRVTNTNPYSNKLNFKDNKLVYVSAISFWNFLIEFFKNGVCKITSAFPDLIIFDDYDNESLFYFLCLSLLNYCKDQLNIPILLQTSLELTYPNASIFKIPETSFPIDIRYHNKNFYPQDPVMIKELSQVVSNFYKSTVEGDFLVILTKTYEVESLKQKLDLKSIASITITKKSDLNIINEIHKIQDQRMIIITTNQFEPLISLVHLGIIFETMYEKRVEINLMGGVRETVTQISKQTLKKYCRRISRNFPGMCYRMFTLDNFEKLNETPKREWTGYPIWYEISQMKRKGIDAEIVLGEIIDKVKNSFDLLNAINLCTDYEEESCAFANHLMLNPRNSLTLFKWIKETQNPVFPCIVAVCMLDCFNSLFFKYPRKDSKDISAKYNLILQEHRQKFYIKYSGYSDLETLLNIWREMMSSVGGLDETPPGVFIKWAKDNSFDINKTMEIRTIVIKVVDILREMNNKVEIGPFDNKRVIEEIRPILAKTYNDKIVSKKDKGYYYYDKNDQKYKIDNKHSVNMLLSRPPNSIINFLSFEVKLEERINIISCALDV